MSRRHDDPWHVRDRADRDVRWKRGKRRSWWQTFGRALTATVVFELAAVLAYRWLR